MKKELVIKLIAFSLVVIWMMIIYFFSAMPSKESNNKSEKTINTIIEKTIDTTNDIGITNKHLSEKKIKNIVNDLNYPLRKCMHASIYLVLCLLVLNLLKIFGLNSYKLYFFTILICLIYALGDEYHQTFVVGRTGQLKDVLIDITGSEIGYLFYLGYISIKNLFNKTKIKKI